MHSRSRGRPPRKPPISTKLELGSDGNDDTDAIDFTQIQKNVKVEVMEQEEEEGGEGEEWMGEEADHDFEVDDEEVTPKKRKPGRPSQGDSDLTSN